MGSNQRPVDHKSRALTTELSPLSGGRHASKQARAKQGQGGRQTGKQASKQQRSKAEVAGKQATTKQASEPRQTRATVAVYLQATAKQGQSGRHESNGRTISQHQPSNKQASGRRAVPQWQASERAQQIPVNGVSRKVPI